MDKELLKPKNQPIVHYEFQENKGIMEDDGVYKYMAEITARVIDTTSKVIVDAVVAEAREAGVSDLYLLDRNFVLSAIREKIERELG